MTSRHDPSRTHPSLATRYGSGVLYNPPNIWTTGPEIGLFTILAQLFLKSWTLVAFCSRQSKRGTLSLMLFSSDRAVFNVVKPNQSFTLPNHKDAEVADSRVRENVCRDSKFWFYFRLDDKVALVLKAIMCKMQNQSKANYF